MAASNQARARRGWSNTAVSETSIWAMEKDQSKPARRSWALRGSGMTAIMRAEQAAEMAGTEAGADAVRRGGVLHRAQPVVEGLEADAGFGQLALGPLVTVGAAPQWIGRVGAHLEEGRSPLGVKEVEVPVIGHRGLAAPGDVGMVGPMARMTVVDVAPPRRGSFLGLAHQHQPAADRLASGLVLVRTGDVFFGLAHLEADHGHRAAGLERLEFGNQALVVAVEQPLGKG